MLFLLKCITCNELLPTPEMNASAAFCQVGVQIGKDGLRNCPYQLQNVGVVFLLFQSCQNMSHCWFNSELSRTPQIWHSYQIDTHS